MTPIASAFQNRKTKSLFIAYYAVGDPVYSLSESWGDAILSGGADIVELGIPFSDPIGDGPVIQRAYTRALQHPFSWESIFPISKNLHNKFPSSPLLYMSYFNPIYQMGVTQFLKKAKENGISGLIIPDLPFDNTVASQFFEEVEDLEMDLIHLITPATQRKRIREMRKVSSGFVYYVTSFGVTGERTEFPPDLKDRVEMVREELRLPVCCGFGISTPEHAATIGSFADGVIVGSAFQKMIETESSDPSQCKRLLEEYTRSMRKHCP